jgi:ribosome-binding protein aMBF1 (putative translation factor)
MDTNSSGRRKFCEHCGKETDWENIHREEGVMIIQCKECYKVEHVYL